MYSRTKNITLWAGTVPETLYNNRKPFIIPNSVVELEEDENGDPYGPGVEPETFKAGQSYLIHQHDGEWIQRSYRTEDGIVGVQTWTALAGKAPAFAHHSLLVGADGKIKWIRDYGAPQNGGVMYVPVPELTAQVAFTVDS